MAVNSSREEWKIRGNVFDKFTLNILRKLSSQGYFEELESPVAIGKEANIFTAVKKDGSYVIVKIYRLENCNFNKMLNYIKQDARYVNLRRNKRDIIFNWVQREYRNLMISREVIKVPTPIIFKNNIIVMELIGNPIAPQLKDKIPVNPSKFLKSILKNIKLLWKQGLVHGDLSAFNILNDSENPIFIDFSQSTTTTSSDAKGLLLRDLKNLKQFFKKLGLDVNIEYEYNNIIN
jgi:RIO kinase 1